MTAPTAPATKRVRLRWVLWRVGFVVLLTLYWSSGRFSLSTILDLVVALVVVATFSIVLWRVKCLYQASTQACKRAWRVGRRGAIRQLARTVSHLKE